ncbi:MAG TPA: acyl-CoA desaturase [Planctomycetota bacterium]|nr:acyl-CoA desaturase [Planctomycetota bacterium]
MTRTVVSPSPPPSLAGVLQELRAAGLGRPAPLRVFGKFVGLVACALVVLAVVAHEAALTPLARAPLLALGCWLLASAAMCGHDGAHGAASTRPWLNSLLAQAGFTLLGGLSVGYWRYKHNSLHHPRVNVALEDPDVQQGLLALSARQHAAHGPFIRFLQRHFQAPVFWLVGAPLVMVDLKLTSLWFVARGLWTGERRRDQLVDLAWLAAHYVFWLALPLVALPWTTVLLLYAVTTVLPGIFLAAVFAPAHIPYPLVAESRDPLLLQLSSTRNFRTNWFFRFTLIGLDHQVEHHVAPTLPHSQLARAARIVRAYCSRHGLPYHETSWARALWDTTVSVREGWRTAEVVVAG